MHYKAPVSVRLGTQSVRSVQLPSLWKTSLAKKYAMKLRVDKHSYSHALDAASGTLAFSRSISRYT